MFLNLRGAGFKIILTQRVRLPLLLSPVCFSNRHLWSPRFWVQLLYNPWEMILALKCHSGGQPGGRGQEGTRSPAWGRSTGSGQQTPLQPLCPHIQLGRVTEQSHGPGTPDLGQPGEVETGQMGVEETEELLWQLERRCETDEKWGSGNSRVTCRTWTG